MERGVLTKAPYIREINTVYYERIDSSVMSDRYISMPILFSFFKGGI